jgi:SAM-dependent methyltransferase
MRSSLRYIMAAWGLKAFSATQSSRQLYRYLGNRAGQSRHSSVTPADLERGLWIYGTVSRAQCCLGANSTVLELGTGWTHFYSIFLRLFFDAQIVLFDVQDNRQLGALKKRCSELASLLPGKIPSDRSDLLRRIRDLALQIASVDSFDELYRRFNMRYVIEPSGQLVSLAPDTFDMVFSVDVLEHVNRSLLGNTIGDIYRVMKPGGLSLHQIGIDDHVTHYAPGMPSKNYLRFSDAKWRLLYENRLQYFNRLQVTDFLEAFQICGFDFLSLERAEDRDLLSVLTPHRQFQHYSREDLGTTRAYMIHGKPLYSVECDEEDLA